MGQKSKTDKPVVGQLVYYFTSDGVAFADGTSCGEIVRVGRKYFYTKTSPSSRLETKWNIQTLREVRSWGSPPTCYLSRKELDEVLEYDSLWGRLRKVFEAFQPRREYTLDHSKLVEAILDEETS